ncbi:hypothetical protein GCM10009630_51660 [Kribbella jejuensis]|uniref:Uncharacterized protein n=1 Tax=Kribbella jejuensis TaxID=236068 RepID=A0A542ET42_9ACTN|nr:hypothetical protein [Kribbella jejuensis]TQJ18475.1 hypothetical protein FB475_2611 [Kribbella jejuensis]
MSPVRKPSPAQLAARYRRLDQAMYAVFSDVLDYCEDIRVQAEQRLGTTDEDLVITDAEYGKALDVFGEVMDIKTRIQNFRTTWIGDN